MNVFVSELLLVSLSQRLCTVLQFPLEFISVALSSSQTAAGGVQCLDEGHFRNWTTCELWFQYNLFLLLCLIFIAYVSEGTCSDFRSLPVAQDI